MLCANMNDRTLFKDKDKSVFSVQLMTVGFYSHLNIAKAIVY